MTDKKPLDKAMDDIQKNRDFASLHLDNQAAKVRAIDNVIKHHENKIAALEKTKQDELTKMMELMELGVVLTHTLQDGYTITYDNKRKTIIRDVKEFLIWMKHNCETSEVLQFFETAIKAANVKKFVEKKCDEQRANGIMNPEVGGIDIGELTYRRLTTLIKEKK